jgi:hypothetical protein
LANSETNQLHAVPKEMRYNAFRCLRDSGFDAVAFALSNRTVSAEIERGLLEYGKMERLWPSAGGVGILPFGKHDDDWKGIALPAMLQTRFRITANVLAFGLPLIGLGMLVFTFKRRNGTVEPSPAPYGSPAAGSPSGEAARWAKKNE